MPKLIRDYHRQNKWMDLMACVSPAVLKTNRREPRCTIGVTGRPARQPLPPEVTIDVNGHVIPVPLPPCHSYQRPQPALSTVPSEKLRYRAHSVPHYSAQTPTQTRYLVSCEVPSEKLRYRAHSVPHYSAQTPTQTRYLVSCEVPSEKLRYKAHSVPHYSAQTPTQTRYLVSSVTYNISPVRHIINSYIFVSKLYK
ncbi:hypothetical protein J6590_033323 [Homalodisca vitripennis]|nr:hypothetical protein J6590_033323 [Homalodisca vitripennis]